MPGRATGEAMAEMNEKTREDDVETNGVIDTTVQEWLDIDDADMKVIEFRVALVKAIRRKRARSNVTQAALADQVGTRQPNIAKIEAGGVGVSLDLLLRVFFATGGDLAEVVEVQAASRR
jgi:DNA-binding XRE family transcriptional regulator